MRDILRTIHLRPYLRGAGPTFKLVTWDTHTTKPYSGKSILGYRLTQREHHKTTELFSGEDFACSPLHAIDSDACLASLLVFLTLRPGDTDAEYFDAYTPAQRDYCEQHAEALSCYCLDRFGER